jgi:hypothetical protein
MKTIHVFSAQRAKITALLVQALRQRELDEDAENRGIGVSGDR